jgi:hypothetical protein
MGEELKCHGLHGYKDDLMRYVQTRMIELIL